MKKDKILTIIIIIVGLLIIGESYNIFKTLYTKDNKILENIKVNETFNNRNNMLSIQIQNDGANDYGFHESTDRTQWPDKNIYTFGGAECTDGEGAEINYFDVLSFDETSETYTIHIKTKKTIYCTLFFSKGKPAKEYLTLKGGSKFNSSNVVFGLYRFNGIKTDVANHDLNNYICFGTTNLETCTGNDKQYYLYRIIGITDGSETNTTLGLEANQLKIIRAYPSNQNQQWGGAIPEKNWSSSLVVPYLNDAFLTNDKTKWQNVYWEGIIDEPYWYIADKNKTGTTETTTPLEKAKSTQTYKVGLMYLSDYVNAGVQNTTNWLFIANGIGGNPTKEEWTMTRYGYEGATLVWNIYTDGKPTYRTDDDWYEGYADTKKAIRPVFYLKSDVTLYGEGTESSPFIITNKK